jgi:type II restriction enzyme
MDLSIDSRLAGPYTSPLQRIRFLREHWVSRQVYCPHRSRDHVMRHDNDSRVAYFFCAQCSENFDLKKPTAESF